MTDAKPDWTMLNAYVDGELSASEAAAVARAAETDPDVAEQIDLLYRLKGALHGALPSAPEGLAEEVVKRTRAGAGPSVRWRGVLAVAAALAAAGLIAPVLLEGGARQAPAPAVNQAPEFLALARSLHLDWLSRDASDALVPMPTVLDTLTRFGRLPLVPDLQTTGLQIGLAKVVEGSGGRMLEIGYRGHHGCHLSYFVATDTPLPDLSAGGTGDERARAWQVDGLTYLLLADGMDPSRFDLIAQKIEGASRRFAPLDSQDREELAENHRLSRTCQV